MLHSLDTSIFHSHGLYTIILSLFALFYFLSSFCRRLISRWTEWEITAMKKIKHRHWSSHVWTSQCNQIQKEDNEDSRGRIKERLWQCSMWRTTQWVSDSGDDEALVERESRESKGKSSDMTCILWGNNYGYFVHVSPCGHFILKLDNIPTCSQTNATT